MKKKPFNPSRLIMWTKSESVLFALLLLLTTSLALLLAWCILVWLRSSGRAALGNCTACARRTGRSRRSHSLCRIIEVVTLSSSGSLRPCELLPFTSLLSGPSVACAFSAWQPTFRVRIHVRVVVLGENPGKRMVFRWCKNREYEDSELIYEVIPMVKGQNSC